MDRYILAASACLLSTGAEAQSQYTLQPPILRQKDFQFEQTPGVFVSLGQAASGFLNCGGQASNCIVIDQTYPAPGVSIGTAIDSNATVANTALVAAQNAVPQPNMPRSAALIATDNHGNPYAVGIGVCLSTGSLIGTPAQQLNVVCAAAPPKSGTWYPGDNVQEVYAPCTVGTLQTTVTAFQVASNSMTISRLGVWVTGASVGGAVEGFIESADGSQTILADSGAISTTTTGNHVITLSTNVTLSVGTYFQGVQVNSVGSTAGTLSGIASNALDLSILDHAGMLGVIEPPYEYWGLQTPSGTGSLTSGGTISTTSTVGCAPKLGIYVSSSN